MHEYVATVTSKGQLTLPAGARPQLGIDSGDQVAIVVDGDHLEVRRVKQMVEAAFQSIPTPLGLVTEDFDDLIEEAMADHADELIRPMREGSK